MSTEQWRYIRGFTGYSVSNFGRIYHNRRERMMSPSVTNWGHVKISLLDDIGIRQTCLVKFLVAEAFVDPPKEDEILIRFDHIIFLDGDLQNVAADNLAWRPKSFAWRYHHQLRVPQPRHYENLVIHCITTGSIYENIVTAGMVEGLLFDDIWRSTYSGAFIFPLDYTFEVLK